jgi:thymidylate synthase (FAD)
MQFKTPVVINLANTTLSRNGLTDLYTELGVEKGVVNLHNILVKDESDGETLAEIAGRLCYKSFEPGLNKNVTKVRQGNKTYINNILESKHGSVLEHSSSTFAFLNVSRVFTHEVVRHRVGTAFSQESLRYVILDNLSSYEPDCFDDADKKYMEGVFNYLERVQLELSVVKKVDELGFKMKKILTSAFRRFAPIGLQTNIIVTGNHRAWRHIIEQRCNEHAEEEIRKVIFDVACYMNINFPSFYQDMELDYGNQFAFFKNSKI